VTLPPTIPSTKMLTMFVSLSIGLPTGHQLRSYHIGSNATMVTMRGLTAPHSGDGAQLLITVFVAGSHSAFGSRLMRSATPCTRRAKQKGEQVGGAAQATSAEVPTTSKVSPGFLPR